MLREEKRGSLYLLKGRVSTVVGKLLITSKIKEELMSWHSELELLRQEKLHSLPNKEYKHKRLDLEVCENMSKGEQLQTNNVNPGVAGLYPAWSMESSECTFASRKKKFSQIKRESFSEMVRKHLRINKAKG